MFKTLTKDLNKCELIDVMRGLDCEEDMCEYTSIQRVLRTTQACDVFGGEPEDSYPLIPGTYMALYYNSIAGDPYPLFERICENIINDENKSQTLLNGDGIILIFMLNKYE